MVGAVRRLAPLFCLGLSTALDGGVALRGDDCLNEAGERSE